MTGLQGRMDGLSPARRALLAKLRADAAAPADEPDAPIPLSYAQEQLWFLQQLEPHSAAYTVVQAVPFDVLDLDAFRRALDAIVDRHAILRTRYVIDGETPVQVVERTAEIPLAIADEQVSDGDYRAWVEAVAAERFELATGPVLRAAAMPAAAGAPRWRVLLAIHHIAIDGWSMSVLLGDLRDAYEACAAGRVPRLIPAGATYTDHARAQRTVARERRVEAALSWWRECLAGAPQLDLPFDRLRPARPTHRASVEVVEVDAATTAGLEELARDAGASLFMCALTGYAMTLARWTGQLDVLVGCPAAGRDSTDFERVVGLFVNTLPVRVRLDGEPTFRALVGRVRRAVLDTVEHENVPFARLVRELAPHREPGVNPLFQTTLQLTGARDGPATARSESRHSVAFDLQVDIAQLPAGLGVHFAYDRDLFDAATVRRLAGTYRTLLAAVVADPDRPITELDVLGEFEVAEIEAWNRTAADVPDRPVHDTVLAVAQAAPDAVAVADGPHALTYAELVERSARVAAHLAALGAGPEQVVAVVLPRGADLAIAQLAVLRTGAAFLPLDPATPPARLAAVLDCARPVAAISTAELPVEVPAVRLDRAIPAAPPADGPPPDPARLAYVIATSGSTGVPKLVEIEHHALSNLTAWHARMFGVSTDDRAGFGATVSFDASVWEIWANLTAGATLVVPPDDVRFLAERLAAWLAAERITTTFVPTPVAEELLTLPAPAGLRLRNLLTGGDVLHRLPTTDPPFALWNLYGPTECTVVATQDRVRAGDPAGSPPPIGGPIANASAHVLDLAQRPVPVGAIGELYVGGAGVARGYRGEPELTATAFPVVAGERRYRTGDLVRRLPDGRLRFLGRADDQLKIRGVRVETGDVIAQLVSHPAVRDAIVVPHDGALAAYVVPASPGIGPSVTAAELRAHAAERLPAPVVPARWTFVDALPLTANGKLDMARLPPPAAGVGTGGELAGPVQAAVAELFAELLGASKVGPGDDFLALGGHSLLATRLVMRIRARLGVDVALRTVFENGTVRGVADVIETARRAAVVSRAAFRPIDRSRFRAVLRPDGTIVVDDQLRAALAPTSCVVEL